ncbi:hypothetical protein [Streptomyces sp. NPDC002067]
MKKDALRLTAETFELNCVKLVKMYGEGIDRALRIDTEYHENRIAQLKTAHRKYVEGHNASLAGLLHTVTEIKVEAGALRSARLSLRGARKTGGNPLTAQALVFVVDHADRVHGALVRQEARDRAALDQALGELCDASGPAYEYLLTYTDFLRRQREEIADASFWIKGLHEAEVIPQSEG